jgi:alpha-beta hydrolase superfamily lysophospholipase
MRLAYVGNNVKNVRREARIANSAPVVVVDVANVMGARADGWWRDRAAAALRLGREVTALARADPASEWVLVLEGRSRDAAPVLAQEAAATPVRVVSAPGSGDDTIVQVVVEVVASDENCLVVTADRELRQRCEELSASVVGPGWLLGRL